MRTVNASTARAELMALLDEVARGEGPVEITKRGRVVARLVAAGEGEAHEYPLGGEILCDEDSLIGFRADWPDPELPS